MQKAKGKRQNEAVAFYINSSHRWGMKIIHPTITLAMAQISTVPAATSLATRANG
jgi:hypothetical protein